MTDASGGLGPVVAVDIGATTTRVALVHVAGPAAEVRARERFPTEAARGFEDFAGRLDALVRSVAAGASPVAVGVCTAGPVDPATGEYRFPPNLPGWHGRSLRPGLEASLGLPVAVGHDATVAALAETRFGHRRGARDLVYLTVSTGIGAGIVSGGRAVTGHAGGAGEAGHLIVNPGGAACGAGCPGCLEGAASGAALAAEAARRIEAGDRTALVRGARAEDVVRAAEQGDPLADAIMREAIGHLGAGIASLLALLDPEAVIVGGGVARGLEPRWAEVLEAVEARALPRYRGGAPVEPTTLGDDASLLGAAVIALEAARGAHA
ncbi:MAG: ROK family protein [Dehalococcoidia bacterium]|nr:ROK family protein [Dehalococcoidia bacterium]